MSDEKDPKDVSPPGVSDTRVRVSRLAELQEGDEESEHPELQTPSAWRGRLEDSKLLAVQSFRMALQEDLELKDLAAKDEQHRVIARGMTTYLVALVGTSYHSRACAAASISYTTIRRWRREYPWFMGYEELAEKVFVEILEQEIDRRAFTGVNEPVFGSLGGGEHGIVGYKRVFSDRLAELRLRALAPDRYADRKKTELTGPGGGPVQVQPVVDRLRERIDGIVQRRAKPTT